MWILIAQYAARTLAVIAILGAAWFGSRWLGRTLRRRLAERHRHVDRTLGNFAVTLLRWALMGIAALICLNVFGIEVTSLAALLGALGVTVGLALQGSLSNLAAGVVLLAVRPFRIGDLVETAGARGRIDDMGLLVTRLVTLDHKQVTIPNKHILDDNVCNHTRFRMRRYEVLVGVAYGSDLARARAALERAADRTHRGTTAEQRSQVALTGFGASSIDWVVRAWGPSSEWVAMTDALVEAVHDELLGAGIEIPFPQLDLHVQHSQAWQQLARAAAGRPRDGSSRSAAPCDSQDESSDRAAH